MKEYPSHRSHSMWTVLRSSTKLVRTGKSRWNSFVMLFDSRKKDSRLSFTASVPSSQTLPTRGS